MTRFLTITLLFEAVFFASLLSFLARPSGTAQLLVFLLGWVVLILWGVTFVRIFIERVPKQRLNTVAMFLSVPLLFWATIAAGRPLRNYLFQRDLPQMQAVVNLLKTGALAQNRRKVQLPAKYQGLADLVRAQKSPAGVWTVEFLVGGGFPVKHFIYLYKSDDKMTGHDSRNWPNSLRLTPSWFECSD